MNAVSYTGMALADKKIKWTGYVTFAWRMESPESLMEQKGLPLLLRYASS